MLQVVDLLVLESVCPHVRLCLELFVMYESLTPLRASRVTCVLHCRHIWAGVDTAARMLLGKASAAWDSPPGSKLSGLFPSGGSYLCFDL